MSKLTDAGAALKSAGSALRKKFRETVPSELVTDFYEFSNVERALLALFALAAIVAVPFSALAGLALLVITVLLYFGFRNRHTISGLKATLKYYRERSIAYRNAWELRGDQNVKIRGELANLKYRMENPEGVWKERVNNQTEAHAAYKANAKARIALLEKDLQNVRGSYPVLNKDAAAGTLWESADDVPLNTPFNGYHKANEWRGELLSASTFVAVEVDGKRIIKSLSPTGRTGILHYTTQDQLMKRLAPFSPDFLHTHLHVDVAREELRTTKAERKVSSPF